MTTEQRREIVEALWHDPANWRWGMVYICEADPRVVVPKKIRWTGWTLNFAHGLAWLVLLAMMIIAVGPMLLVIALGFLTVFALVTAFLFSLVVIVAWSIYLAGRYT